MKGLNKLLIIIFAFIAINVNAASISIGSDSAQPGESNKKVPVELTGNDLSDYTSVEFGLSISGTSYANFEFSYNASMTYKPNGNSYTISNSSGLYSGSIGNIVYSTTKNLNTNFSFTPTNVVFTKNDGTKVNGTASSGTISYVPKKSSDAYLTSLSVTPGKLSPEFSKDLQNYNLMIDAKETSVNISADSSPGSTREGTGLQNITEATKSLIIKVTSEDGKNNTTYTINIIREGQTTNSLYLKSLKINTIGCKLSPKFNKTNTKYSVDVTEDIESLDFDYETEDPSAIVKISGNKNFGKGKNVVKITVKDSEEKNSLVYKVTVNKEYKKSIISKKKKKENTTSKKGLLFIILGIIVLLAGLFFVLFKKNKIKFLKKLFAAKGKNPKKVDEAEKKKNKDKNKKKKTGSHKKAKKKKRIDDFDNFDDYEELEKTTNYDASSFIAEETKELEQTKEFDIRNFKD